ncbi:hypothetical protein IQ06DRAFT_311627 [Phaeosphaeriaceae sp. SRC1lsM3a]|nr:hypothetical protein IQ06DRAFT_311627 [Stagonospora sp. SRC1lsM3a]
MSSAAASVANFIVSLVDGVDTTLQHQPNRPSGSVLRARRRVLFGVQLPSSAAGNDFADLYSPNGLSMTFQSLADLQRVVGDTDLTLDMPDSIPFPQTVELNNAWCIGAPGQQRDIHFAIALQAQLMPSLTTSRLQPNPDDMVACSFTTSCRRETPEYKVNFAVDRALRDMGTTPIFKHPKVWMMPISEEQQLDNGDIAQAWFLWQVCTNCMAVRAKARCSHWHRALGVREPLAVFHLKPGEKSSYDAYAWFTPSVRDAFLNKDLGYYDLWTCRDGTQKSMLIS